MGRLRPFDPRIIEEQAARILAKLGGPANYCRILASVDIPKRPTTVMRWLRPKTMRGGTGGLVPFKDRQDVLLAAKLEGVELTTADWYAEPRRYVEDETGMVVPEPAQEKRLLKETEARLKAARLAERDRLDPHGKGRWTGGSIYTRWQGLPKKE